MGNFGLNNIFAPFGNFMVMGEEKSLNQMQQSVNHSLWMRNWFVFNKLLWYFSLDQNSEQMNIRMKIGGIKETLKTLKKS